MESTGVYWKPVYHVLGPSGLKVWIVNARHVKNVPGHKTDKKDSAWLCKLLLAGLLKPSYIPPKEQRGLRDLTRYRKKLVQDIASNKNRIVCILEDCNAKLSSVLSDTGGACGRKCLFFRKAIQLDDSDARRFWKNEIYPSTGIDLGIFPREPVVPVRTNRRWKMERTGHEASRIPCRQYDQNHYRPDFSTRHLINSSKADGSIRHVNTELPAGISMLLGLPCRER